jgi:hypothetical protein
MSESVAPAKRYAAVTPSDATIVDARALYIGGAGNVTLLADAQSSAVTFTAVPVGSILPCSAYKVMAATTATLIVALY